MHEDAGDGHELMTKASHTFIDAMNKTAEVDSSPVGSAMFDVSTGDSFFFMKIELHLLPVGWKS